MSRYIDLLVNNNISSLELNYGKFDLSIENCISEKKYKQEIDKIIFYFLNSTYLNPDGIRLNTINNIPLAYTKNKYGYFKIVYNYAIKSEDNDASEILAFFINSLFYSYNNGNMYKKNSEYKKFSTDFNNFFPKKMFYKNGDIKEKAIKVSKEIINYAIENYDLSYYYRNILLDCLKNIMTDDSQKVYSKSILKDILTKQNSAIIIKIIKYDNEIYENIDAYFKYVINNIKNDFDFESEVINKLYSESLLTKDLEKKLYDAFEYKLNEISTEDNGIVKISLYQSLSKNLTSVRNISNMSIELKCKLKNLQSQVLANKRALAKKGLSKELSKTVNFQTTISKEEIDSIKKKLKENLPYSIISLLYTDWSSEQKFDEVLKSKLYFLYDQFSESMYFDSNGEGIITYYSTCNNNVFKEYYTKKLDDYFKQNKENYINKHLYNKEKIYVQYLEDVHISYELPYSIVVSVLREIIPNGISIEEYIFDLLFSKSRYNNLNYYTILVPLLTGIEYFILKIYNKLSNEKCDVFNIEHLYYCFKELSQQSDVFANKLMSINYIIFDRNGINLRNYFAHGNFKSDYSNILTFLMVINAWIIIYSMSYEISGE